MKLKIQIIEELNQKAEKTSPELVKLHEELIEMKRCHSLDLERAEQKAVEAEERSSHLRIQQAQCLKITQNVSFECLNFGIFCQFLSDKNWPGNTF